MLPNQNSWFPTCKKKFKTPVPKINNIIITKVDDFNFLGLTLDVQLNWIKHSKNISNKCSTIIGTLNRLKLVLPMRIKIMLYNTLLVPHINYCLMTWGFPCQKINQVQKRAIRIITLSNFNSHTDPLFKKLNLLKVNDMLALQKL